MKFPAILLCSLLSFNVCAWPSWSQVSIAEASLYSIDPSLRPVLSGISSTLLSRANVVLAPKGFSEFAVLVNMLSMEREQTEQPLITSLSKETSHLDQRCHLSILLSKHKPAALRIRRASSCFELTKTDWELVVYLSAAAVILSDLHDPLLFSGNSNQANDEMWSSVVSQHQKIQKAFDFIVSAKGYSKSPLHKRYSTIVPEEIALDSKTLYEVVSSDNKGSNSDLRRLQYEQFYKDQLIAASFRLGRMLNTVLSSSPTILMLAASG